MEPITEAILSVLPALATELVKPSIKDAYEGLKAVICRKCGNPVTKAIAMLEEDPSSKSQAAVLEENIIAAKANEDGEVLEALRLLVAQMKLHGIEGERAAKFEFNMSGGNVQGVAGAQTVQICSMTFGAPPKG